MNTVLLKRFIKCSLIIFLAQCYPANAACYYLSGRGDDLNSGTRMSEPWQSLDRLMKIMPMLEPGDSVLFERGSVFTGSLTIQQSGKPGNEIYFGAYGSGSDPVISGTTRIAEWTRTKNNIWASGISVTSEPGNLILNGIVQPPGRYPDKGYLPVTSPGTDGASLSDSTLNFEDGFWEGSEVVVQSSRWTLDNLPVASFRNKTFSFSAQPSYSLPHGAGYFIQKHPGTLNSMGEWCVDPKNQKILLVTKPGKDPNRDIIEISTVPVGLNITQVHDVIIEHLNFFFQRKAGMQVSFSHQIKIQNCQVGFSGFNGIEVTSCQSITLADNRISGSGNNGIEWRNVSDGIIRHNDIRRTGMVAGRGASGNGTYCALRMESEGLPTGNNLVVYNTIDSTGYLGVDFRTGRTIIKNNLISNFCKLKDDGGAIYTWGNAEGENSIEGNIIFQDKNQGEESRSIKSYIHGIYIDDRSSGMLVARNTVSFCPTSGIFIHNSKGITLTGNTLFGNGTHVLNPEKGQLMIVFDNIVPETGTAKGLQIAGNTLLSLQESTPCYFVRVRRKTETRLLGESDNNQFIAPRAMQTFSIISESNDFCEAPEDKDLPAWRLLTGSEKNSRFNLLSYHTEWPVFSNLVRNGNMTNGTEGWITWPDPMARQLDKIESTSLKINVPLHAEELLYQDEIELNTNKTYRLSFVARSPEKCNLEFVPLMARPPWSAVGPYYCFSLDSIPRTFIILFKPEKSSKEARINFKSKFSFWLGNIMLHEVPPVVDSDRRMPLLLTNPGMDPLTIHLQGKSYSDLSQNKIQGSIELPAYASRILFPAR